MNAIPFRCLGWAAAGVLAMGGWSSAAQACTVDTTCSSTCGGETCYWSGTSDDCVPASDPTHSWCNSPSDCNCPGAQCIGNHCSIVLPQGTTSSSGGSTGGGATSGGGGTAGGAGSSGSGYGGGGGGGGGASYGGGPATYPTSGSKRGCSTGAGGDVFGVGSLAALTLLRRRRTGRTA